MIKNYLPIALFIIITLTMPSYAESEKTNILRSSVSLVDSMLSERHDLRVPFFGNLGALDNAKSKGCLLLVPGNFQNAQEASTNDCNTVASALKRLGFKGISGQPQVRIIQQNKILQSSLDRNADIQSELDQLRLEAGDIVIVARRKE